MWRCTQYDDFDDLEQSASVADAGLAEDVFRHLRLRILNGEFAGGDKLRELTLAKEMAVSRATIREATRALAALAFWTLIRSEVFSCAPLASKKSKISMSFAKPFAISSVAVLRSAPARLIWRTSGRCMI